MSFINFIALQPKILCCINYVIALCILLRTNNNNNFLHTQFSCYYYSTGVCEHEYVHEFMLICSTMANLRFTVGRNALSRQICIFPRYFQQHTINKYVNKFYFEEASSVVVACCSLDYSAINSLSMPKCGKY
jgi:hypothetical protein